MSLWPTSLRSFGIIFIRINVWILVNQMTLFLKILIEQAMFDMAANGVAEPDGFQPYLFEEFWGLVKDDIFLMFQEFYDGRLNIDGLNCGLNCAYVLIILPKVH